MVKELDGASGGFDLKAIRGFLRNPQSRTGPLKGRRLQGMKTYTIRARSFIINISDDVRILDP